MAFHSRWAPRLVSMLTFSLLLLASGDAVEASGKSRYTVTLEDPSRGAEPSNFELTVFDTGGSAGGRRWVYTIFSENGDLPGGLPMGALVVTDDGRVRPELFNPRDLRPVTVLLALQAATTRKFERWEESQGSTEEKIQPVGVRLRREVDVTIGGRPRDEGRVQVKAKMKGGAIAVRSGRRPVTLTAYEEDLLFESRSEGGDLVKGEWHYDLRRGEGDGASQEQWKLTLDRTDDGSDLAPEDLEGISGAYEWLEPVVRALLPGVGPQAVKAASKRFTDGKTRHRKGPLSEVITQVDDLLDEKKGLAALPQDPDARAEAMMGSMAPDFALKDLDGNEVRLSSLRGKVVLLNFWGFT